MTGRIGLALTALLLAAASCRQGAKDAKQEEKPAAPSSASEGPTPLSGTPVHVARTERRDLVVLASGPGRTVALAQQRVRPPFAGTLTELTVSDGDTVRAGQIIGRVTSRDSEAAVSGAREMLRQARTPAEKSDAERALALAERGLVVAPLKAPADGAVVSHAATAGDRIAEDQEILSIADARSIAFLADLPQSELSKIASGQRATVEISGRGGAMSGTVHAVLPAANPNDFTAPVRIDLGVAAGRLTGGLFGTAHILVGEHRGALVVPESAAIRDDISGVTRVATIRDGKLHWVTVAKGLEQAGVTEVSSPELSAGEPVIASGHVGLPEGAPVIVTP